LSYLVIIFVPYIYYDLTPTPLHLERGFLTFYVQNRLLNLPLSIWRGALNLPSPNGEGLGVRLVFAKPTNPCLLGWGF
jgi:hypothetical protein